MGGPAISLLLTLLSGAIVLALRPVGGTAWWGALLFFLENAFIFTLGALMPLPFSDGGAYAAGGPGAERAPRSSNTPQPRSLTRAPVLRYNAGGAAACGRWRWEIGRGRLA